MRRRIRRNVKIRRVVRRLELWSVFKVAVVCHTCCYGVTLGVGSLLWRAALRNGVVGNLEKFMREIGFADDFRLDGPTLWRGLVFGGLALLVINTIATVLLAFFYNIVAGLLGGLVVSMLEEAPTSLPASAVPYAVDATSGARRRRRAAKVAARAGLPGGDAALPGGLTAAPGSTAPAPNPSRPPDLSGSPRRAAGGERSQRRPGSVTANSPTPGSRASSGTRPASSLGAGSSSPTGSSPRDLTASMQAGDPTLVTELDESDWFESSIDEESQSAERS